MLATWRKSWKSLTSSLQKIDLFKSIVNRRFRHKRMIVSRNAGIEFMTDAEQPLNPTNLSSGEQHELVMLYELLFKMREDSLILIDEPEISLHIAWQEEFLQDLTEMVRLSGFNVLIATHSPQIINDRWDLTVELHDSPKPEKSVAMRDQITAHTIASEVRMRRTQHNGTFLLVEGPSDKRVFRNLTLPDACRIVIGHGWERASEVAAILYGEGFPGMLTVLDADFRRLDNALPPSGILLTDFHDLECMMFASPALPSC